VFFALLAGASTTPPGTPWGTCCGCSSSTRTIGLAVRGLRGAHRRHRQRVAALRDPDHALRRTATEDTEINGTAIQAGDKVALWYIAGNRDPEAFPDPEAVRHHPARGGSPGLRGGGPHYCIGHLLGRRLLRTQIHQVYTRMKDLQVGDRHILLSKLHERRDEAPASWTPGPRA